MKIHIRGARDGVKPETTKIVNDSGGGFHVFVSGNMIQLTAKSRMDKNADDSQFYEDLQQPCERCGKMSMVKELETCEISCMECNPPH